MKKPPFIMVLWRIFLKDEKAIGNLVWWLSVLVDDQFFWLPHTVILIPKEKNIIATISIIIITMMIIIVTDSLFSWVLHHKFFFVCVQSFFEWIKKWMSLTREDYWIAYLIKFTIQFLIFLPILHVIMMRTYKRQLLRCQSGIM